MLCERLRNNLHGFFVPRPSSPILSLVSLSLSFPSSLFPNLFPHLSFPRLSFPRPSFPRLSFPCEITVLGAAIAAGTAVEVWEDTSLLPEPATKQFQPALTSVGEAIAAV